MMRKRAALGAEPSTPPGVASTALLNVAPTTPAKPAEPAESVTPGAIAAPVVTAARAASGVARASTHNSPTGENINMEGLNARELRNLKGQDSVFIVGRQCNSTLMSRREAQIRHHVAVKHTSIEIEIILKEWRLGCQSKGSTREGGERGKHPISNRMRIVLPRY